jgi:ElaB/YqjD/DUF883 family membrane-anchored ribosome-binding protein
MSGMLLRTIAVILVLGLGVWGPAVPSALAQVEITPAVREACEGFEPGLREIALNEIVPAIEAEPEGSEARVVETTAVAIAETTQTVTELLSDPDQVATQTVTALKDNGVPANVASGVERQLKDALAKAHETLAKGGTLEEASKYFESCQKAMADCQGYLGGKDFKEIFTAGGVGFDRPELGAFCGTVFDPSQRDAFQATLEGHFAASFQEAALRGPTEGPVLSGEMMRGMMEQMMACGVNPADVMRDISAPPKEVLDAMSGAEKTMFEAWQRGDFAALEAMHVEAAMRAGMEAGMSPEMMGELSSHMAEMMTLTNEAAMMERYAPSSTSDAPRTETSGTAEATAQRYADGHTVCGAGTTHAEGVAEGVGHCL